MRTRGYVELESGVTVALADCLARVPLMTFLTRTHIDVCDALSRRLVLPEEERRVFVNLLRAHSVIAREITAAVSLINAGKLRARRLVCSADPQSLAGVVQGSTEIDAVRDSNRRLLDDSQLLRFLIKALAHKLYRLWPRSRARTDLAVRSWVELSEMIYPEVYRRGTILVYPFYLNVARHIRYIRRCRRQYQHVQLIGLPYGLTAFFRDLLFRRGTDTALVMAEARAFRKHADEILLYASRTLYCNDEFEAGVVCLANRLKGNGVKVVNTSHGLSFGSPYVGYDEFFVYNRAQARYYGYRSSETKIRVEIRRNASVCESLPCSSEFRPVILLMHGNFTRSDLRYERRLELSIISSMKQICRSIGVDFNVKLHPNATREDIDIFEKVEGVETIRRLDELGAADPIFVATITTALYDFYHEGPFLFVNDGIVGIEEIYGYPYPCVRPDGLEKWIRSNLTRQAYSETLRKQVEALEEA